jgi:hypothetical protein
MNAPLVVEDVVAEISRRYGKAEPFGRSRIVKFGSSLACSINYSKLLSGHKYFFGLSKEVVEPTFSYPETKFGDFVLLVCGNADNTLVLPRSLVIRFMQGVSTRRIDVFYENGSYILQTTRHPKLNVSEFLNAFPKQSRLIESPPTEEALGVERQDRLHVKVQWALIQLGQAEGCSVWVPPNDRSLSYQRRSFATSTLNRLPNFGFDENTRRIVHNIDVLWLNKNVIRKAFEVESTTSIYSGLLRLNDLVLSQPNNKIDLYIVANQSRRQRVYNQLLRPSFQALIPRCELVSFDSIEEQMKHLQSFPMDRGARVSGLIRGERFEIPEHYAYPSGV